MSRQVDGDFVGLCQTNISRGISRLINSTANWIIQYEQVRQQSRDNRELVFTYPYSWRLAPLLSKLTMGTFLG